MSQTNYHLNELNFRKVPQAKSIFQKFQKIPQEEKKQNFLKVK